MSRVTVMGSVPIADGGLEGHSFSIENVGSIPLAIGASGLAVLADIIMPGQTVPNVTLAPGCLLIASVVGSPNEAGELKLDLPKSPRSRRKA